MIRRPPRSTLDRSSAASGVYKRQKYKSIGLDRKSVEIGQSISIVNSDNGETISELIVTGIKYGNQIRMCWINNDANNDPPSYIVVGGCKP